MTPVQVTPIVSLSDVMGQAMEFASAYAPFILFILGIPVFWTLYSVARGVIARRRRR